MERSNNIYLIIRESEKEKEPYGSIVAGFTVKHEALDFIRSKGLFKDFYQLWRYRDGNPESKPVLIPWPKT